MLNNIVLMAVWTDYVAIKTQIYIWAQHPIGTEINHSEWSNYRKRVVSGNSS